MWQLVLATVVILAALVAAVYLALKTIQSVLVGATEQMGQAQTAAIKEILAPILEPKQLTQHPNAAEQVTEDPAWMDWEPLSGPGDQTTWPSAGGAD